MKNLSRLKDALILGFSLLVIIVSVGWSIHTGVFNFSLTEDSKIIWHLVRSSGIVAYILLLASTVWGLFISSQFVKNWSPGPVSMTVHSTISWLALLLSIGHAVLLLFDDYFAYTVADILVPFTGPYRPLVVGFGTFSMWILMLVALSFPLKKFMGHITWKRLHYLSYIAFGLISIHGIFAGTDGTRLGFRLLVGVGVMMVLLLLGIRLGKEQSRPTKRTRTART